MDAVDKQAGIRRDDEFKALQKKYKKVFFDSVDGKIVLANILLDLRHFFPAEKGRDIALQNYAKTLLTKCGVWENPDLIVSNLNK